jgi:superfamily I DNA/RNA helicase
MLKLKLKIIGDAGTGKTHYLKSIIQKWKIPSCSHTKTAVERLRTEDSPASRTIHSIALKLALRDTAFKKMYERTVKAGGIEKFRQQFCKLHNLKLHHDPYTPCEGRAFFSLYSYYANTLRIPENIANQKFTKLIPEYEKYKEEKKFVDYEDFILVAIALSEETGYKTNIVIDEAQDLSPLQWTFIEKIADVTFLAGDELQSIFSFQGATPEIFANIQAKSKILDYNYRIPSTIWETAGEIVKKQLKRKRATALYEGGLVVEINQSPETVAKLAAALSTIDRTLLLCRHNSTVIEYARILDKNNLNYTLVKMEKNRGNRTNRGLLLDTIHSCKGLEAPFVIMVDEQTEKNEEEDRIRYVGMTRASAVLIIANQMKDSTPQPGYIRKNFDLQISVAKNLRDLIIRAKTQYRILNEQKKKKQENQIKETTQGGGK